MKDGSLILLPSHKSHLDYIFLIHVFLRNHLPLPVVAAGDNLAFFPVGQIFRRGGAFFIRRNFHGDRLYGAVVDAYMRRLIMDGWSLEFFLEGGRSRTGKLLAPKLGLLSLAVDAALGVTGRKIYFAPMSIGYERIVEEKAYVRELSGGEKQKEDVRGLLASTSLFRGKYGRLNLQIGELLTLEGMLAEIDRQRAMSPGRIVLPPPSDAPASGATPTLASRLTPREAPRAGDTPGLPGDERDQPRDGRDPGRAGRHGAAHPRQARHQRRGPDRHVPEARPYAPLVRRALHPIAHEPARGGDAARRGASARPSICSPARAT